MGKTAALVVTYNRKELLLCCLQALQAQTVQGFDVIVIDNASTDGTAEMCRAMADEHLYYFNTGSNLGGAGGFAYAVEKAVCAEYEHLWLMDDDTLPEPDALQAFYQADKDLLGNYGWLSSRALAPEGNDQAMNMQRCTPYKDIAGFDFPLIPAVMASFVSLYLNAQTVRELGLPIADFFIWSDDWEYTRRISLMMKCYVVPASRVVHAMKNPTVVNIATDTPDRWTRYRYFYRNDVYLYRREGLKGWLWLIAKDCWHSVQVLAGKQGKKSERLRIIWKGFSEGLTFTPSVQFPRSEEHL